MIFGRERNERFRGMTWFVQLADELWLRRVVRRGISLMVLKLLETGKIFSLMNNVLTPKPDWYVERIGFHQSSGMCQKLRVDY